MTDRRSDVDLRLILDTWMDEVAPERAPVRLLDESFARTMGTRQLRRYPWHGFARRWSDANGKNPLARMAAAVIAIVVVVGAAIYALSPSGGIGGVPTATSSPASAAPTRSVAPSASAYVSSVFEVPIQLTLADGWKVGSTESGSVDLSGPAQPASIMSIASMTVRGVRPTDPWVQWPADIQAWLSKRPEFRPAAPRSITVGGRPASVIDVDVVLPLADTGDWVRCGPIGVTCGINLRSANVSGAWRIHMVVIRTGDGTGIVGYIDAPLAGFQEAAASLDGLLATLQFR